VDGYRHGRWNYAALMNTKRRGFRSESSVGFSWSDFTARDGSHLPYSVLKRITWYESNAQYQRKRYYAAEIAVILLSAAIPAAAAFGARSTVGAVLGALVVVVGGLRHLYRWQENWIRSGHTVVGLQAEIIKWGAGAAPYQDASDATAELVTRVESIVEAETSSWASTEQSAEGKGTKPAA
jgi:Protein of unknown function (DUF4231)